MGDGEQATVYFVCDVETTGSCPGVHALLGLGCVAYREDGTFVDQYYITINDGLRWEPSTKEWWDKQSIVIWEATRVGQVPIVEAMPAFTEWVDTTANGCLPVCVSQPSGFDFTWIYYLTHRYAERCPFVRRSLDVKSYAMGLLGKEYAHVDIKTNWPEAWKPSLPHSHHALQDSAALADTFLKMRKHGKAALTDLSGQYLLAVSPRGSDLVPISYALPEAAWSDVQKAILPSTVEVRINRGHTVPGTSIRVYAVSTDDDSTCFWLIQYEGADAPLWVRYSGMNESNTNGSRFSEALPGQNVWVSLLRRMYYSIDIATPDVVYKLEASWLSRTKLWV